MKKALRSIAFVYLLAALFIPATAFAKGPIAIKNLPYTISVPGNYTLAGNLTYTANLADAITISANNVTLDMGGYGITGPGKAAAAHQGVAVFGDGVEVRNGYISGFYYGLFANNSISPKASNLRVHDNHTGIDLESTAVGAQIKECTVYANASFGIYVVAAGGIITNNVAYNNGTADLPAAGIAVNSGSCVIGNSSYGNTGSGIVAGGGCTVKNNSSFDNTQVGIVTLPNGAVLLDGNAAYNNTVNNYNLSADTVTGVNTP